MPNISPKTVAIFMADKKEKKLYIFHRRNNQINKISRNNSGPGAYVRQPCGTVSQKAEERVTILVRVMANINHDQDKAKEWY